MINPPIRELSLGFLFVSFISLAAISRPIANAADFHVSDAAELHSALLTSSGNGEDDAIYLAEGGYGGNFRHQVEK